LGTLGEKDHPMARIFLCHPQPTSRRIPVRLHWLPLPEFSEPVKRAVMIAAHELTASDTKELKLAIEICEDLLNYLYELDYKSSNLTKIRQEKEYDLK
jgi:hypothetical protein